MLLRRVTKHIKDQNWFAVGIDFFIVVLGVFIGLQVANWNEAQQIRQNEAGYLKRLDQEFDVIEERLADGKQVFESSVRKIDLLLTTHRNYTADPTAAIPDDKTLLNALASLTRGRVPAGSPAAFKEMVSKGALDTLTSEELRQALFAYDEFASIARDAWSTIRDEQHMSANKLVWLLDVKIPVTTDFEDSLLTASGFGVIETVGFDKAAFFDNPNVRGYLSVMLRSQANQYSLVNYQLELVQNIEALIAKERL